MKAVLGILAAVILLIGLVWFEPQVGRAPESEKGTTPSGSMILTSPGFAHGGVIPAKFTCSGDPPAGGINPELLIQNVPEGAASLALIMDDPDAPRGTFTHWTVWGIDPATSLIKEESVPPGAIEGGTGFGRPGYGGPCPPPGKPHRYYFRLFALDVVPDIEAGASREELEKAMNGHIVAQAELMGTFGR